LRQVRWRVDPLECVRPSAPAPRAANGFLAQRADVTAPGSLDHGAPRAAHGRVM
jgi:hypothetical protein